LGFLSQSLRPGREQKEERKHRRTGRSKFAVRPHFVPEGSVEGRTAPGKAATAQSLPEQHGLEGA
jgi:hypothetical protein